MLKPSPSGSKPRPGILMRWFRFYNDAVDDPKVQRLPSHLFKTWMNLLCLASKFGGKLPSDDDISFMLRMSVKDTAEQIEELILFGLIDLNADKSRAPHSWEKRQYVSDSSAGRMRNHREKKKKNKRDGLSDVTVTVQSRAEQNRTDFVTGAHATPLGGKGRPSAHGRDIPNWLIEKAEGLGLPVDELRTKALKPGVKNPTAMFNRLAVADLHQKLPNAPAAQLEAVFQKGNNGAWAAIQQMLLEAAQ